MDFWFKMKLFLPLLILVSSIAHAQNSAFSELLEQAELNNPRAQYQLSQAYQNGKGVTQSSQDALYWLEQAANNRYQQAQIDLVEYYLSNQKNKNHFERGIYWLTKLALNGNDNAQYQLGMIYQSQPDALNASMLAKLWFQMAAETNPAAEAAYSSILQDEFNQQRVKQLAEFDHLNHPKNLFSSLSYQELIVPVSSGVAAIAIALVSYRITRRRKLKMLKSTTEANTEQTLSATANASFLENQQLKQHIARQEQAIKKQQQLLSQLSQQLRQPSASHISQASSSHATELDLACAMFGYEKHALPPVEGIKQRYKQLCKIYHPDLRGSDEEMKRLNHALKLIMSKRK